MNCRKGDIAIIVGGELGNEGGMVRVVGTDSRCWGEEWLCEALSELRTSTGVVSRPGEYGYCEDRFLRPITPPPGTISDEEVRELYSPTQEPAHV